MDNHCFNKLCFNTLQLTVHPIDEMVNPYNGQMVYDQSSNKMKVYSDGVWKDISIYDDDNKTFKQYPTVCPNCGSPHNPSSNRCEYCGTYFK